MRPTSRGWTRSTPASWRLPDRRVRSHAFKQNASAQEGSSEAMPSASRSSPGEPVSGGEGPFVKATKGADLAMHGDDGRALVAHIAE